MYPIAARLPSVIAIALGLLLIGAGAVMLFQGLDARTEVRDALVAERIITAEDAAIPNAPVDSAATARAQADVIKQHVMEMTDGRTFSEIDREDPLRQTYLASVTLRTSLMSAYMAFKLADLVIGLGALFLVLGAGGAAAGALAARASVVPSVIPIEERQRFPISV
jgi:hypothetical protein